MQYQWLLRNNKLKPYDRVPQAVHLSTQLKDCYHVAKDAQELEPAFLLREHQCHVEIDKYCMTQQAHSYTDGREMKIC